MARRQTHVGLESWHSVSLTTTTSNVMLTMNNVGRLLTVDRSSMARIESNVGFWPLFAAVVGKSKNQGTFMLEFESLTCFPFEYFN